MRPHLASAVLFTLTLAGFLALAGPRDSFHRVSGDEGTFLAMAQSLALDGDLVFGVEDRERIEAAPRGGRQAIILQRTDLGVTYSKPPLYPILAAPFVRLFGEPGMVAVNVLAWTLALILAAGLLRRLEAVPGGDSRSGPRSAPGRGSAGLTLATFAGAAVATPLLAWKMSDALQMSLALAGLVLCLAQVRGAAGGGSAGRLDRLLDHRAAPIVGAIALGLLASARLPNLAVALLPVAALAVAGRRRRGLLVGAVVIATLALAMAGTWAATGAANPYKAHRATFNPASGYPAGPGAAEAAAQFDRERATHSLGMRPRLEPRTSLYAALYFLIGRHTGLLIYFPAVLALLAGLLRRPDRVGLVLLAGAGALAVFYLLWMPRNYFGGASFVGNRYFVVAYPVLLVALARLPSRRWLAASWALAGIVYLSALVSVVRTHELDPGSQNHAYAGLFRRLPYESTAPAIEGKRDRWWSPEWVRFVDPFAAAGEWDFTLAAGAPPAELLVANAAPHQVVRFLVSADAPDISVTYEDWRRTETQEVAPGPLGGALNEVRFEPAAAWRRHPFWWEPGRNEVVRAMRLSVATADGRPAQATFHYLGRARLRRKFFSYRVLEAEIPELAETGGQSRLEIRLRNTGSHHWSSDDRLPVFLRYRLVPLDGADPEAGVSRAIVGPPIRLPRQVGWREELTLRPGVEWPTEPGRYTLELDLVVGEVGWFRHWMATPMAAREVVVRPAAAAAG